MSSRPFTKATKRVRAGKEFILRSHAANGNAKFIRKPFPATLRESAQIHPFLVAIFHKGPMGLLVAANGAGLLPKNRCSCSALMRHRRQACHLRYRVRPQTGGHGTRCLLSQCCGISLLSLRFLIVNGPWVLTFSSTAYTGRIRRVQSYSARILGNCVKSQQQPQSVYERV